MDRASAFVVAVSAGAVGMDRGLGRSIAGSTTAIAWEHSGHLPDDVPLHELVGQFLEWSYQPGNPVQRPEWAREKSPAYTGPIEVGMRFTWAKGDPKQECDVDVTRVDDGLPERRIWTRHTDRRLLPEWQRLDANARMVRVKYGVHHGEAEFRESATPCQ